jgi:hypothetical protein
MKPKRATDRVPSRIKPRSPKEVALDLERFKHLVVLIDQPEVKRLIAESLRERAASGVEEFMSTVKEIVTDVAAWGKQLGKLQRRQLSGDIDKVIHEPLLKTPHLDDRFVSEEAVRVSETIVRHWINWLLEARNFVAHDIGIRLDEELRPMRPEVVGHHEWNRFETRMESSLTELLADFSLDILCARKILRGLADNIRLSLAHSDKLSLPKGLTVTLQEGSFYEGPPPQFAVAGAHGH